MYYEVWEKEKDNKITVAIVFRGTDQKRDWLPNLRWAVRHFLWDQYHQVQALIPRLVKEIYKRHQGKGVTIVTLGHSLGGGLAQQAAYVTEEIHNVYAFNSSPVTGFTSITRAHRHINKCGVNVTHVYQKGEVLAFLRALLRRIRPLTRKNPTITEIRFNLAHHKGPKGPKNPIAKHGMWDLAVNLYKVAKSPTAANNCPD
ncbi:MAG: DUF6792 domain-containing protein [Blastocatellia bacterium]